MQLPYLGGVGGGVGGGMVVDPLHLIAHGYAASQYSSILDAPPNLLQLSGAVKGSSKLYAYRLPHADYVSLVLAHYAMSGQYHPNTASKWLGADEDFLTSAKKQRILRGSLENLVVPLPLDLPAEQCSAEFYAQHLAGSLVLLCCDAPDGDTACLAVGVFVGDRLWRNTLDPSLRFRGRRENFDLAFDANHLLAPVHVITSLLQPRTAVTLSQLGDDQTLRLADGAVPMLFGDQRLPAQLQLLVCDVGESLAAAQPAPPGSRQRVEQKLAAAFAKGLSNVGSRRFDDANDFQRVAAVQALLSALRGGGEGGGACELPPTKRHNLAASRQAKKASQETRRLLSDCAKNTKNSMGLVYGDYATLARLGTPM